MLVIPSEDIQKIAMLHFDTNLVILTDRHGAL